MPESCRRVLSVLDSCNYASQKEICSKTGLSMRSVKSALKRLTTEQYADERQALYDLRRKAYQRNSQRLNAIGIVGGLGPEATARAYICLSNYFREKRLNPEITIDNAAIPTGLEEEIILKSRNEGKLLPHLKKSIERLNRTDVSIIIVPCNTAHLFIDELRKLSKARILSIIEATANEVRKKRIKAVGILATTKTTKSGLYQKHLKKEGVTCIVPYEKEQEALSNCILSILKKGNEERTKNTLLRIAGKLVDRGAKTIILACTDLSLAIRKDLPNCIDSLEALLNLAKETVKPHSQDLNKRQRN